MPRSEIICAQGNHTFWNLRISRRATVPGRKRWGFFVELLSRVFLALIFFDRRRELVEEEEGSRGV